MALQRIVNIDAQEGLGLFHILATMYPGSHLNLDNRLFN